MAEKDNEEAIQLNEMITLVATACVLSKEILKSLIIPQK
jgi:hypothetical protein